MSVSNLVVPVVLWGRNPPTHCISAILMTQDEKNIITGCNDGQIAVWDVTEDWKIYPRSMLFGHSSAISCLCKGSNHSDKPYIVSSSESGEMCLWDINDGRCIEFTKMPFTHTNIQTHQLMNARDIKLVCNGYYPEIHIIDPLSLEIQFTLTSKVQPDWISALCILRPVNRQDDVVVAISNSGAVKCWTLSSQELKSKTIAEDESKQIRCLNAHTLRCCAYNQRTVLIVCSKYWQLYSCGFIHGHESEGIYDAGDFSLLCSESNPCGERWLGGEFISVDRVVVWSNEGKGYLYKLPTNANPRSADFHGHVGPSRSSSNIPYAYNVLNFYTEKPLSCPPAMSYFFGTRDTHKRILLRGDSMGRIMLWMIPKVADNQLKLTRQESFDRLPVIQQLATTSLLETWDTVCPIPSGVIDALHPPEEKPLQVTATCYIPSQGKLVCGRLDGTIVIVPATQSAILQLLDIGQAPGQEIPVHRVLSGHTGKVTYVLYPFNDSTRYEPQHLVSGGVDFTIILWDIFNGTKLHTFSVHGGEITRLIVPPNNCNNRVLTSICSVASDHSVALISLRERKCIMLAGRQLFPVQTIKWRPLDDFLIIGCTDGTVYVWQMETGHLDRVVQGVTAQEILSACDKATNSVTSSEELNNPTISIAQAFKRRNLATFKNLAQQKLHGLAEKGPASYSYRAHMKPLAYPMMIQGMRTNSNDPDAHVILFDTEALIVQLLSDEYAQMSPGTLEAHGFPSAEKQPDLGRPSGGTSPDPQRKLAEFIAKVKVKAEDVQQKVQAKVEGKQFSGSPTQQPKKKERKHKQKPPNLMISDNLLTMEIAQLYMSCLHAWSLDPDLDKLCTNKLGLLRPCCPISFGLISRGDHMSLLLPGWQRLLGQQQLNPMEKLASPLQPTMSLLETAQDMAKSEEPQPAAKGDESASDVSKNILAIQKSATRGHWQISSSVTTQHLLSVISIANTLMSMSRCSFLDGRFRSEGQRRLSDHLMLFLTSQKINSGGILVSDYYSSSEAESGDEEVGLGSVAQAQIKQGWSLLAALHCVLLPDIIGEGMFKPPLLEMLARRWQHRCLEIREAAQALLLAELRRIRSDGRKTIVDQWSPYLPSYVDPHLSILSETHVVPPRQEMGEEDDEDDDQIMDVNCDGDNIPSHKSNTTFESRRRQATAIVMLGVIGAEFGQEIEPSRRKSSVAAMGEADKKKVVEGFGIKKYSLAMHTSKALTFLLLHPPSPKLPAHTPIRRAAIDLIGRGFTVWEPYMDVSAVLLGLLELCVDGDRLVPRFLKTSKGIRKLMTFGLPLSPAADACRTARHALSLIATARPPAFVITMAKEVARYNAMAQNAQSQNTQLNTSVLVRAKPEILRIIELLVEKMPNDVVDLLVEAMDVIVHCLDPPTLKSKGLTESFPSLSRFSMVSYCGNNRRICVGAKSGGLAFYELKQSKCQIIPGHTGAVTAVTFSPDGKFLASYSHVDNKLMFWQMPHGLTASTGILSLGQQHTKCVRTFGTPPCNITSATNLLKLVKLAWLDGRTVVLWTADGTENKFRV
ncbi:WD repeat-containing protein 7-like isoform X4 [Lineus longissimus]|uniref:WD repeat-containing protein 7-like isoform X4 n=1 Tax=Lineus longissimus TaxID=88925 RepID=UPI00315DCDE0